MIKLPKPIDPYSVQGLLIQLEMSQKYCSNCELFETCEWSWLNLNNAGCWE